MPPAPSGHACSLAHSCDKVSPHAYLMHDWVWSGSRHLRLSFYLVPVVPARKHHHIPADPLKGRQADRHQRHPRFTNFPQVSAVVGSPQTCLDYLSALSKRVRDSSKSLSRASQRRLTMTTCGTSTSPSMARPSRLMRVSLATRDKLPDRG
jgi:hypothetical protein